MDEILEILYLILSIVAGGWVSYKFSNINSIVREYNHIFQLLLKTKKRNLTCNDYNYERPREMENMFMEIIGVSTDDIKQSLRKITYEFNQSDIKNNLMYKNIQQLFDYIEAFEEYNSGFPIPDYGIYGNEITYLKSVKYISKSYLISKIIKIKSQGDVLDEFKKNFYDTDFSKIYNLFNEVNDINIEIVGKLKKLEIIARKFNNTKHRISGFNVLNAIKNEYFWFYIIMIPIIILLPFLVNYLLVLHF